MPTPPAKNVAAPKRNTGIVAVVSAHYGIEPERLLTVLRGTAFKVKKSEAPASEEELLQLLVVAKTYNLNPFTHEIYAFRGKDGGIVPIIGVDGWVRIVEAQPTYQGEQTVFGYDETRGPNGKELGFYCACSMHRSDRKFPITRPQYYNECYRNTDPWNTMPTRMLAHRAYIQSARAAFGLGGIYDSDEGEVVAFGGGMEVIRPSGPPLSPPAPRDDLHGKAEDPLATDDQIEMLKERMAKTGMPDSLLMAKFEVGKFEDLKFEEIPAALKFVADNAKV